VSENGPAQQQGEAASQNGSAQPNGIPHANGVSGKNLFLLSYSLTFRPKDCVMHEVLCGYVSLQTSYKQILFHGKT